MFHQAMFFASLCAAAALHSPPPRLAVQAFSRTVRTAERSVTTDTDAVLVTPSYVAFTLAFNLAAHIVATHEAAVILQLPPPLIFAQGVQANLGALLWGAPGALAVAAIEIWRCDGCT